MRGAGVNDCITEDHMGTQLTMPRAEARRLVEVIRAGLETTVEAARRLRDERGWEALGYESWTACCRSEFGHSRQHVNRLIAARPIQEAVATPNGSAVPESHARELARLPEDQRVDCYADCREAAEQAGKTVTASDVREAVNTWVADNEPYQEQADSDDKAVDGRAEPHVPPDEPEPPPDVWAQIEDAVRAWCGDDSSKLTVAAARLENLADRLRNGSN
jgi:hypothetical protein